MPFNKEQQAAIDARGKTILVSAPAGSGKTRILVSRMDSLIKNDGYDMHAFLVLTFTDAAGQEMKQRLNIQLHEDLHDPSLTESQRAHILTCIEQLPHAYMTTFDSFCKSLLEKYGYLVDVMPGFSVESTPDLLKSQILDECIETWIHEEAFIDYMKRHNTQNNFDSFKESLLSYDNTTNSYVSFVDTLEAFYEKYYEFDDMNDAQIFKLMQPLYVESLQDALSAFNTLQMFAEKHHLESFTAENEDGLSVAGSLYNFLSEHLQAFSQPQTYDTFNSLLADKPMKAPRMDWDGVEEAIKKEFNTLKTNVLAPYKKMKEDLAIEDEEAFKEILQMSYKDIYYILGRGGLLERFHKAYSAAKKKKGILDFHDLEAYATALLSEDLPVLATLNNTFKEIMLDEYQDTNQIQENLVTRIAGQAGLPGYKEIPMFMVGDMKQSIYRFRQADPRIFKEKFDTYKAYDEATDQDTHIRIDLRFNYRSEKAVLDSINYIFDSIMDTSIGGLEYYRDKFAILRYDHQAKGKTLAELEPLHDFDSEILLAMNHNHKEHTKSELEAHMVAQKILTMCHQGYHYRDFCVLMRNASDFITYKKVFESYGINANITLSKGLLSGIEVLSMKALLTTLVNPYDDIAMVSVLHNHFIFSQFDENKLLEIRQFDEPMHSVYEDLLAHRDDSQVASFLEAFETLRKYTYSHSPYEILRACFEATGYRNFVAALINGEQRVANLDTLLELARSVSDDYPYLKDFVDFLDSGIEKSPGKISSDDTNAVEFMTIHKSKGLQFKVVFVSGLYHQFNAADERNNLLLDQDKGIASTLRFYKDSKEYGQVLCALDHPYRALIGKYIHKEAINEEMRILYVALTRAESKLIMTGVLDDEKKLYSLAKQVQANDTDESVKDVVYNHKLRSSRNYLDWILMACMRHEDVISDLVNAYPDLAPDLKLNRKKFAGLYNEHTRLARFHLAISHYDDIFANASTMSHPQIANRYEEVAPYYTYAYPYPDQQRSVAVTTLQALEDEKHFDYLDGDTLTREEATSLGTLVHNVLSYLSFKNDNIKDLIEALNQAGMFTSQEYALITNYAPHIQDFIESPIYQEAALAKAIYKEKMFRFKEAQVINGIFDLVFVSDDHITVLDYKTDHISKSNKKSSLIKKHQLQLDYYKKVLQEYFHQDVKGYVYYLETNQCVEV